MILSLIRQHPRLSLAIGLILLVIGVAVVGGVFALTRVYAQPPQPLPFQHSKHIAAGASCLYCHPGVVDGAVAGLPSSAKCMGCHANVQPKDPADQKDIDQLIQTWDAKQPIQWVKVTKLPGYAYFNHRPHIAAGVACESCHGNVGLMGYAQPYNLNMGFCLQCHNQQAPEKIKRLIDCATCHR
jgi:hypothetical protein